MPEFIKPQLCKTMTKKKDWRADAAKVDWRLDWVAEFKLDGHRRLLGHDEAWSRIGKDRPSPAIQPSITPGTLLDGEICMAEASQSHLVAHEIAHNVDGLTYVAFDILYVAGECVIDLPWYERRTLLENEVKAIHARNKNLRKNVILSEVIQAGCEEDIADLMLRAEEMGVEGLVLKKRSAPYKAKSRSAWVKFKFTDTMDVIITDCESKPTEWRVRPGELDTHGVLQPEGRHSDPWLAGHVGLSYGFVIDGEVTRVGSLGVTGTPEDMKAHVGKVAEVKVYGQFEDTGALRHPIFLKFRDDKLAEECVFERSNAA